MAEPNTRSGKAGLIGLSLGLGISLLTMSEFKPVSVRAEIWMGGWMLAGALLSFVKRPAS